MLPAFPLALSVELFVFLSIVFLALLRWGFPRALAGKVFRRLFVPVAVFHTLAFAGWGLGVPLGYFPLSYYGACAASVGLVFFGALTSALPFSALFVRLARPRVAPAREKTTGQSVVGRRAVLEGAAVVAPTAAAFVAGHGFVAAAAPVATPVRTFEIERLPSELDGLRILQLSDMHLGFGRNVSDFQSLLSTLDGARRPDLVVLTGDIAEDLKQLEPMLDMLRELSPRLGILAALGNHEHLNGVRGARAIFERCRVPLLIDEGIHLEVGNAKLYVAGIDDPVIVHTDVRPRLYGPIERALRDASSGATRILLSHRPEGFESAAAHGVDLTLAGHTHGGQIGFSGKSAFEPLFPDGYLWGSYARGHSQLYTTCGFGAWFPFRLGCPGEAPIIELRAPQAARLSRNAVSPRTT